ncbi:uncharacterized protein LOC117118948 [Anneissia japonica]|uniref:uncharacterized protein LOC117118948 n=1 Tax=Anneissia japonica TaxID=1529436 RepID=UPI0014257FD4|nr:uncharacterized protein LOC117118948 [Anneissia japonica]
MLTLMLTYLLFSCVSRTLAVKTIEVGPHRDQLCGQTINMDAGRLVSTFAQQADVNLNCILTVLAPADRIFQLEFLSFKLPAETPLACDNVQMVIYDGPAINSLTVQPEIPACTNDNPTTLPMPVVTSGNAFTFSFRYDGQIKSQVPIDVQIHFTSWKTNIKKKDPPEKAGHAHKIAFIVLETITGLTITAVLIVGIIIFLCRNCRLPTNPDRETHQVREISSPTHGGHSYFSNADNQYLLQHPPAPAGRAPVLPFTHHGQLSLPPPHRIQSFYPSGALHPSLTRVKVLPLPRQAHGDVGYDTRNEIVYMNR